MAIVRFFSYVYHALFVDFYRIFGRAYFGRTRRIVSSFRSGRVQGVSVFGHCVSYLFVHVTVLRFGSVYVLGVGRFLRVSHVHVIFMHVSRQRVQVVYSYGLTGYVHSYLEVFSGQHVRYFVRRFSFRFDYFTYAEPALEYF